MATEGNVKINIDADASDAKKAVDEVKSDVEGLDSAASETGDGAFSKLGSAASAVASTIAKTATAAVAALGAATLEVGKEALEAYADYEQLVGGVETLFGAGGMTLEEYAADVGATVDEVEAEYDSLMSAQETVLDNAANAYQTAGMSANDYMETVTSFSAALISSLEGDTEAAAEVADTAITDMADNANKMGTDIEDIQNAYQGFAKQNYTMLDNLKLGYGGTKSEMERLIEDANELKEAQGEAGDLTIDSYADIVEAIHLVQDEMGITGTTALEASETISGSISSAKAAWENWLVGIADEDADMGALTEQLVASLQTAATNVLPRISQIGEGLAAELPTAMAGAIEALLPVVAEAVSGLWNSVSSVIGEALGIEMPTIDSAQVTEAFQAIVDAVSGMVEAVGPVIEPFVTTLVDEIGPALVEVVTAIADALTPVVEWLIGEVMPFIADLAETALPLVADAVDLVLQVVQVLATTFKECWGMIKPVLNNFLAIAKSVFNGVAGLVKSLFNTVKNKLVSIVTSISDGITSAVKLVTGVVSKIQQKILNVFKGAGTWLYSAGKNILTGLANGISGAVSAVIRKVTNVTSTIVDKVCSLLGISSPSRVFAEIGDYTMQGLAEGIAEGASKALAEAEGVVSGLTGVFGGIDGVTLGADYTQTLQVTSLGAAAQTAGTVVNQTFDTKVVRSDQDLYTAVPTIVRAALREANYIS